MAMAGMGSNEIIGSRFRGFQNGESQNLSAKETAVRKWMCFGGGGRGGKQSGETNGIRNIDGWISYPPHP